MLCRLSFCREKTWSLIGGYSKIMPVRVEGVMRRMVYGWGRRVVCAARGGPRPMDEERRSTSKLEEPIQSVCEGHYHLQVNSPRLRFGFVGSAFILATSVLHAADLAETTQLFRSGKYADCVQATEKAIAENDFSENYRLLKLR